MLSGAFSCIFGQSLGRFSHFSYTKVSETGVQGMLRHSAQIKISTGWLRNAPGVPHYDSPKLMRRRGCRQWVYVCAETLVTNSKYRAVTKSKIMEGARNNRSEQGCDRNYGNCWGWTMNRNTCILVNKSSNGDNNIQCMRRLILGIVLTGSQIVRRCPNDIQYCTCL